MKYFMQQNYYNNSTKVRVYTSSAQGGRKYMEDEYSIVHHKHPSSSHHHHSKDSLQQSFMFFGIFDGHGGEMAAQYTRDNLCRNIVRQKEFWSEDNRKICLAIHRGFVRTQRNMLSVVGEWPKTSSGLPSTAGTTASVVFVMNGHYFTGHVGDSRIILGRKEPHSDRWIACPMTRDHKPESPREKERIEACGGKVMNKSGVGRVVWNRPKIQLNPNAEPQYDVIPFLAVARALGDLWSLNKTTDQFVVSPEPDVHCVPIDSSDRCLILASDGLWNMMNNQAAVKVVQDFEQSHKPFCLPTVGELQQSHASQLLDVCMNRWSQSRYRADNTTVLTILFDTNEPHFGDDLNDLDSGAEDSTSELTDSEDEMIQNVPPITFDASDSYYMSSSNSLYDIVQDYYFGPDPDTDEDPKDMLNMIGDTIHTFKFDEDVQEDEETVVNSILSSVLEQVSLQLEIPTIADHCDYHTASDSASVRLATVSHHHYDELTDEQLSAIRFHHWNNSYVATEYMQNNFATVLTVDRELFGECVSKWFKNARKPLLKNPLKIVLHESQNLLQSSSKTKFDEFDCAPDSAILTNDVVSAWPDFFRKSTSSDLLSDSAYHNYHVANINLKRKFELDLPINEEDDSTTVVDVNEDDQDNEDQEVVEEKDDVDVDVDDDDDEKLIDLVATNGFSHFCTKRIRTLESEASTAAAATSSSSDMQDTSQVCSTSSILMSKSASLLDLNESHTMITTTND